MKRLSALIVTGLLGVATSVLGTTTPAHAATYGCGSNASDVDHGTYRKTFTGNDYGIRSGPYAECYLIAYSFVSDTLDYHCFTVNSYGYGWTFLRDVSLGVTGWVKNDHLTDGGSTVPCP